MAEVYPHNGGPGSGGWWTIDSPERLEYHAACRRQAGYAVREVVSQLPRLTSLIMYGVKIEDHVHDFASLHPWTELE